MDTIKINASTLIPTNNILRIVPLGDADRAQIAKKLEIDASKFQTRIEFGNGTSNLAAESVDDIQAQGLALVDLGSDRYVPAANIISVSEFSKDNAAKLESKGYKLGQEFVSSVKTSAGQVLSAIAPEQIMNRRSKAVMQPSGMK